MSRRVPDSYARRLLTELDAIESAFADVLSVSAIVDVDPNRGGRGSGMVFIGFAMWGWAPSSETLEADRMALLRRVRDWGPRYRLLFPHPTPTMSKRLDKNTELLESWLVRKSGEHDVPSTMEEAAQLLGEAVADVRSLADLFPADEYAVRLAVDTNTLIDNPDLAVHVATPGGKYMVRLLPVVLRELDDLKRGGKTQDLREAAKRAERRLKGLRTNGDASVGVRVAGGGWRVTCVPCSSTSNPTTTVSRRGST
ncbi:PIN domain-containing protein [Actinokineospora cianjurensis]|uniref:PIN domain-containing protein n=1 Tax=Actinokineospora cianjurensis TaxID=585224 RepID=UPI001B86640F|nr:PIN domain-containing protein [Actinokineospora cianjurensis]